jgi:carboxyl-terminal processing protease
MSVLSRVASNFIYNGGKSSSLITYEKDSDGNFDETRTNSNKFPNHITAISVIANEKTASASECLLGAMLYYKDKFSIDSLVIENEKHSENYHTFGKGIMQTTYPLSNGGGIKLTTAVLYQPDKTTSIHNVGIIAKKENSCLKSDGIALLKAISVLG